LNPAGLESGADMHRRPVLSGYSVGSTFVPGAGRLPTRESQTMNWEYVAIAVRRLLPRVLLADWFLLLSVRISAAYFATGALGCDFRIYHRALLAWLSGGDPWSASVFTIRSAHFDAPPSSLYPLLPLAPFSEDVALAIWFAISVASAVFVVRRLRLGIEWLLFPPLVVGVLAGNPGILLLALLVAGRSWTSALGAALKIYAVVPLAAGRKWRALAVTTAAFALMFAVSPGTWIAYASRFGEISGRLAVEAAGGMSATSWWPLIPPTVIALVYIARRDLRTAGWLLVPAIWPGSQWHWSTFAMPVATPLLGAILAPAVPGLPAVAVCVYALVLWAKARSHEPAWSRLFPRAAVRRRAPTAVSQRSGVTSTTTVRPA
jgi:hypothetical protein